MAAFGGIAADLRRGRDRQGKEIHAGKGGSSINGSRLVGSSAAHGLGQNFVCLFLRQLGGITACVGGKIARLRKDAVCHHLKMAGVAGYVAGVPQIPDDLTGGHGLPGHNGAGLHVGVQRDPAQTVGVGTVVDLHKIAPAVMLLRGQHNTVRGGVNLGALIRAQVVAPVAVLGGKAGNIFVLDRADKARAVRSIAQCRQGRGLYHRRGRFGCLGGLGSGRAFRYGGCGLGLCGQLRPDHAGGKAEADHGYADRQRPRAQTAVVQQMHDAPLYAALPEGQAARHPLPLYSKLQQRFTVGAALGQGAVLYGGLITGGLHVALKTAER